MNPIRFCILALVGGTIAATGCTSSLSSTKLTTKQFQQGLVYYLPKKDAIVAVTRNKKGALSVAILESPMYPDLGNPYRLDYEHNVVSKNSMKVGIGANGLLTSANSTTESGIGTALSNLASSLGTVQTMTGQVPETCDAIGTYSETFDISNVALGTNKPSRCGVLVSIQRWGGARTEIDAGAANFEKEAQSGLYYRQNEPFLVEASWSFNNNGAIEKGASSKLILSPSRSNVRFLPIKKTLFAGNIATLGFENGIPNKYEQDVDSEVGAFLSLPATVIASYFDAIGKVFDGEKGASEKERQLIEAELKLAEKERDADMCRAALEQDDDVAIKERCH